MLLFTQELKYYKKPDNKFIQKCIELYKSSLQSSIKKPQ